MHGAYRAVRLQIGLRWLLGSSPRYSAAVGARQSRPVRWPDGARGAASSISGASAQGLYKDTLCLPKTEFPMKLQGQKLLEKELEIQKVYGFADLYTWQKKRKTSIDFCLHDGPPYANGNVHMGHALNKILKDITNRFHVMRGDRVHFMPGWDCHGLPTEMKALSEGEVLSRNLDPMETRQKAQKFAEEAIAKQKAAFIRWGVMADWDSGCYSTFEKEYVAKQLELFFNMYEKGYIYQAFKPVYWSPATKTALAEAELEYNPEHVSRASYVKFPLSKPPSKLSDVFDPAADISVVVWTTQPWTIPANEAVCFLPNANYCLAKCDSLGERLLVAVERVPTLADALGMKLEVLQTFSGLKLEGGACRHPTIPMKEVPLLPSNHVTIEKGTGLVHIAPAHGMEDYNVASHQQLPVECLVNEDGIFTEKAGEELVGKFVMEQGNQAVVEQLRNAGQLLKEEEHVHSYPYDWRVQRPVLIRASHQWFVDTSAILKHALTALENVETYPKLARGSMQALLPQRTYWCISRQRSWGVPIPVFYSCQSHQALINKHTVQHVAKLVRDHGTDCWWTLPLQELLPNALLEKSGKSTEEEFERGVDIMDVWFDSGSSWASVLESVDHCSDLYLEGKDQLSGWFQSSLLLSCAAKKSAPYRSLLVHGFATGEDGQKMSKSRGNVVDPMVVVNGGTDKTKEPAYGADVLRWWAAESNVYSDVVVGPSVLKRAEDSVFGIRNTLRFLLGSLSDFCPTTDGVPHDSMQVIDQYLLHQLHEFNMQVTEAYKNFDYSVLHRLMLALLNRELSSFYFSIIKDRLYCDDSKGKKRRSCQTALNIGLDMVCCALAPILPHLAEEVSLHRASSEYVSVFHSGWIDPPGSWKKLGVVEAVEAACSVRNTFLKAIGGQNPVEFNVTLVIDPSLLLELLEVLHETETSNSSQLNEILMCSQTTIVTKVPQKVRNDEEIYDGKFHIHLPGQGLSEENAFKLLVRKATQSRCLRCRRCTAIGHEDICLRCQQVLQNLHN
uniref:LOW QUALITY PROTEIN: isoleucine--tRNA ligase, mitochondrial n=1 Tax=Myxine glutinosa TaxID=7769 RepID=UPI00358E78C0